MTSVSRIGALKEELEALSIAGLRREMRSVDSPASAEMMMDGRLVANFGSNNYLSLAGHPDVISAASRAAEEHGAGGGGSRLLAGNYGLLDELEKALAELKGTESALVFSTGYLANLGTIGSLVRRGDAVFCDRLNHASLLDGCRISGARLFVYPHNDCIKLDSILRRNRGRFRRAMIVTDGLFSMDGDTADVRSLARIARENDAWLLVDDAHGTGVLGEHGKGTLEEAGVPATECIIQMGTLSKALGSTGGFMAGPAVIRDYLVNRARTLIFETALAPSACAAAIAAMKVMAKEAWRMERVRSLAGRIRSALRRNGLNVAEGDSPIIPVIAGENERCVRWMARLLSDGFYVPAVRPPTVPVGQARLRISVQCVHTDLQVESLIKMCIEVVRGDS